MKTILLIICSIMFLNHCEDEFPFDKDVIVLTDSTFDKAIQKYEYLMVYFYAPWCIRCKQFHPEYDQAASILRKENLFLAKVDATVEKQLDRRFGLKGYPIIKLFIKGEEIDYVKERKAKDVVKWMRRKTNGQSVVNLNTTEEIEKFKNDSNVVLI